MSGWCKHNVHWLLDVTIHAPWAQGVTIVLGERWDDDPLGLWDGGHDVTCLDIHSRICCPSTWSDGTPMQSQC